MIASLLLFLIYLVMASVSESIYKTAQRDSSGEVPVCEEGVCVREPTVPSQTNNHGAPITQPREDKLLTIFTVVQFANVACSVDGMEGTCHTATDCDNIGGTNLGPCAQGFGVCCYNEVTCGGTSSTNCTHMVSPGYPGTYNTAQTCTIRFTRSSSDICQLRMDFVDFESFPPDEFGVCKEDQFRVDGERKFLYLCGSSPPDWHFYLDVAGQANPTVFTFQTSSTNFNRKFKIKLSMIPCTQRVPSGCGQYFTGNSGIIQSFNYGGFYLAGVDYAICTRREKNTCSTTLTVLGPSFVSCPKDLYRLPVGRQVTPFPVTALATLSLYCQLDTAVPSFAPLASITSPIRSINNGPFTIWHKTVVDTFSNYRVLGGCRQCSGFYQSFSHNDC